MATIRNRVEPTLAELVELEAGSDDELTPKREAFAVEWARTGNQAAALRRVYEISERTTPGTVWSYASRVAAIPAVRKRFEELQRQAALETIISIRDALQWQLDIATADPNEVAYVAKRACRYCYGIDHGYQWRDESEYCDALALSIDKGQSPPSDAGGYGYNRGLAPHADCPQCLGVGLAESIINDTRLLTGKARKLYKGVDIKKGELVVVLHDQEKAWEMVCRMLGAFNDKLQLTNPNTGTMPTSEMSEKDAARAYLTMIG